MYSTRNVFDGIRTGTEEPSLVSRFFGSHDFAAHTVSAMTFDLRKFASWFAAQNQEPFRFSRVTTRDVIDFRDHLRRERGQAVGTCNRALVSIRRLFRWLADEGLVVANVAKLVKELRQQPLAPKSLERSQSRKLLREVEVRGDIRANAIFSLMLFTGARVSDVVQVELHDLIITERSGSVVFCFGKGGKQRTVPVPLPARRALLAYLETRPPVQSSKLFIGERGAIGTQGVRSLCDKYAAITGVPLHPHALRHTMATEFLQATGNDLVSLAQILGHESLNTTRRYTQRTEQQLADAAERLTY